MTPLPFNEDNSLGSTHDPSIYDHPVVKDLMAQLGQLQEALNSFNYEATQLAADIKAIKKDRSDFVASIQEQLRQYDASIKELDERKKEIERGIRTAEQTKRAVMNDIDHQAEILAAAEYLEETRARFTQTMEEHDWIWTTQIRDYQMKAIEFVASGIDRDMGGIGIFDQPGLGKTLEARAAIDLIQVDPKFDEVIKDRMPGFDVDSQSRNSVLWVCPDGIKHSTARELAKWSDAPVVVLEGAVGERDAMVQLAYDNGFTVIVGYAQLRNRKDKPITAALFDNNWPIVVFDEVHKCKNIDTSTFQNAKRVAGGSAFVIPMSGTPILNRGQELFATLHLMTRKGKRFGEFERMYQFQSQYMDYYGAVHSDRLIKSISDMVIRRRKDEVLEDLPEKLRFVRYVKLGDAQREVYNMMRDRLYLWLDSQKTEHISVSNFLAQVSYLRQIALYPAGVRLKGDPELGTKDVYLECEESAKLDEAMGLIEELLEADEKVLVYANFNHVLAKLQDRVRELFVLLGMDGDVRQIIGGVDPKTRANFADRFADPEDNLKVLIANTKAGGVGLNLQGACSNVIFLDLDWAPGNNEQAEDRLHRSGQTKDVTVHIIQAENTVDDYIAYKLEQKEALIAGTIERGELRRALDEGLL